jgi:hypothetical protein
VVFVAIFAMMIKITPPDYYIVYSGRYNSTFQRNVMPPFLE